MRKTVGTVSIAAGMLLAACGSPGSQSSQGEEQGLFVVTAGSVNIEQAAEGNLSITLGDVDSRAMWFTDRPERLADVVPVGDLFAVWTELGFADVPPNAGLVLSDSQDESTVIITMLDPVWSPTDEVLQMTGRPIAAEDLPGDHSLGAHTDRLVDELPTAVEHVALFIDPATIPPEFQAVPASCVAVPHVGGPAVGSGDACVPVADLPDFGSGGAAPDAPDPKPDPNPDGSPPPEPGTDSDQHGDTVVGPSMTDDIGG